MFSTRIVFDRRGQAQKDKNNEGTLEVRVTVDRKSYYINTGMRVRAKHWAGAIVARPDADALNNRLGIIVRRVNEEINKFIEERRPIDVNIIKERCFEGTKEPVRTETMLEWMAREIPLLNMSEGTRRHYQLLYDRLVQFGKMTRWSDLTVERIYEWDTWLHALPVRQRTADKQAGKVAERLSDAAVYNYHKYMTYMIGRAMRVGRIDKNPYDKIGSGEFKRGVRENLEYLTDEEMQAIVSLRPMAGSPMCVARDLFVFQLYTGMSYSDTQRFDIRKYKKVDGVWTSNQERVKTGVAYVSVLLPPVVEVLERYGMQAPKMGNADYNHALKAIQMATGITTRLHSHLARHSFATWMLRNGVAMESLAKMMGHTTTRETQKYAKVTAQMVHEDFGRVARLFENDNKPQ